MWPGSSCCCAVASVFVRLLRSPPCRRRPTKVAVPVAVTRGRGPQTLAHDLPVAVLLSLSGSGFLSPASASLSGPNWRRPARGNGRACVGRLPATPPGPPSPSPACVYGAGMGAGVEDPPPLRDFWLARAKGASTLLFVFFSFSFFFGFG